MRRRIRLRYFTKRDVATQNNHRNPQEQRTGSDEFRHARCVLTGSEVLPRSEGARAIEEQQVSCGKQYGEHFDLKDDVRHVKTGHSHEEEEPRNDIDDESRDPPRYVSMKGRQRQLLQ